MKQILEHMHDAILTGNAEPALSDVKNNPRIAPEQQLAIYMDGYRLRLTQAIASDYPALLSYLGEKAFYALAREYVEQYPSQSFNLDRYPHGFAVFVKTDAFALELAKLEGAIAEVFMMEESEPLANNAISPEQFADMVLKPRAASKLLAFDYPVGAWLDKQRAGQSPAKPVPQKNYLYVYRHQNVVKREALEPEEYQLLELLFNGLSIGEVLDKPDAAWVANHLQQWFAKWFEKGFFCESFAVDKGTNLH